tara:strand:- start:512 stop:829 length:318 start_codon:yes stop_codon:yes gene_type:complete
MAQYIKINSQVFNADTFIAVMPGDEFENAGVSSSVMSIVTTSTFFDGNNEETMNYWNITTGSAAQATALISAVNSALTANPGGRVIEVPSSNDYTISSIVYVKGN